VVSSHSGTPLGVGTSHGHFGPWDTPRPGPREYATTILPIVYSATLHRTYVQMAQIPGTPEMESRNYPEIVLTGLLELWTAITLDCRLGSRRGRNRSCSPRRDLSNAMSHAQIGCREGIDSRLLVVGSQTASLTPGFLLLITWAADVRIANARAFSISTFQDLSNDTKNTSMRGVLPLAVELWRFGSPGGLQIDAFSKCWASPPHLAKVGLRHACWFSTL
jgi:hypothetical protein